MKTVGITEFKTHCLRMVAEMGRTKEPTEITKRGRSVAVVNPPAPKEIDGTPGAFEDAIVDVGDVCADLLGRRRFMAGARVDEPRREGVRRHGRRLQED